MWKYLTLGFISSAVAIGVSGQIKKQFSVENLGDCHNIELNLKAKTGNCFIRPSQNSDILNVYSNQEVEEYNHSFSNELKGQTCQVRLALEQEGQKGVGTKISYQVFGADTHPNDKFWKIYLTENTPYSLNLDYGLGNANIDLSGLSIKRLKINTGSADVNVSYSSGIENKVDMDTFLVKVDLGSLNIRQLNLSRSRYVVADVGFGNILMDFSDRPLVSNKVKGSVGAGNMVILLPSNDVPVIVKISESWLCSINLCKSLKRVGENTFANDAYMQKDSKDGIAFDLDVSLGKIIFKEKAN
ncbi:MAG: hypothetical protein JJE09_03580 [Bacteroidia bacterium]|nr:hypothetical protein [Bacteroidia bacterium]